MVWVYVEARLYRTRFSFWKSHAQLQNVAILNSGHICRSVIGGRKSRNLCSGRFWITTFNDVTPLQYTFAHTYPLKGENLVLYNLDVKDIDQFIDPHMWESYSKAFNNIWAASAFKGNKGSRKKRYVFSGQSTMRREGVRGCPLRTKLCLILFCF